MFVKPCDKRYISFEFQVLILNLKIKSHHGIIFWAILALFPVFSHAQDVHFIPKFDDTIDIDGELSEPAWKSALKIEDFHTYYPVDGQAAPEKTVVLFGYNESSLYVAVIALDNKPENIRARISQRDDIFDDDHIVLFLDTFNRGKESYEFCFNPYGIQQDGIYIDMVSQDFTPDYIYYSEGHLLKNGYLVEVEIPFKSLRFPSSKKMTWGFSVMRSVKHLNQEFISPKISLNSTTFIPQFSKLHGFEDIEPGHNFEILPEVTSSRQGYLSDVEDRINFDPYEFDGGLNLKYGPTSNTTFDLTLNPDFSQIEADADIIDVNRRFPFYYDEKRPFFLEGTNIFKTPIDVLYTRRIVDPLGGLKFTGSGDGYELGILQAVDEYYGSSEYLAAVAKKFTLPDGSDSLDADFMNKYGNKKSINSILRVKKNLDGYSNLGVMISDARMQDTYSTTYGVDGNFLIADEYFLSFQALNSVTLGFYDTGSRTDPALYLDIFRGSRTFNFRVSYTDIFPDFEVRNGFLLRKDFREISAQLWYDFRQADAVLGLIRPTLYITRMYDHQSRKLESYLSPSVTIETRGNHTLSLNYYRQFEEFYGSNFDKDWFYFKYTNKSYSWLFVDLSSYWGDAIYYYTTQPFLGKFYQLNFNIDLRPINNWSMILGWRTYSFTGADQGTDYKTDQEIYRFRTTYQFTREIGARLIIEYNDLIRDMDINALLSYQPFPGTVVFLGYNEKYIQPPIEPNSQQSDDLIRSYQGLFMKFSYLFRL